MFLIIYCYYLLCEIKQYLKIVWKMIRNGLILGIAVLSLIAMINGQEAAGNVNPSSVKPEIVVQSVPPIVVQALKPTQNQATKTQNSQPTENTQINAQTPKKEQPKISSQPSNNSTNDPTLKQTIPQQNQLIDQTKDHLANLTQQHQQKLLQEVDILQKIHEDPSLKISHLTNMTQQQKLQLQRRYKQQSRLNYQKVKKQYEQHERKLKDQNQRLINDAKLTKTNQFKMRQRMTFDTVQKQWLNSRNNHNMNQYMFLIGQEQTEDFMIMLPVDQSFYVQLAIYINKDGIYSRTQNIDDEGPLHVFIYQNNNKIVDQKQVYFQSNFYIEGRANCIYTIKFKNADILRLVAFQVSIILQHNHIAQVISTYDVSNHDERVQRVFNEVLNRFQSAQVTSKVHEANNQSLRQRITHYYNFAIAEIVIIIIFCLVQIQLINRLLRKSSIV